MKVMRRARDQLGFRGTFLLFLCLLDILFGWSYLSQPPAAASLHLILTTTAWGWWWIGTGIGCFFGAFVRRDRLFYGAASFLFACYAGAWVDVWISDPEVMRAWVSVVLFGAFAGIVLIVSWWPEVHFPGRGLPQ